MFAFVPDMRRFARKNPYISLVASIVGFVPLLSLTCCANVARKFPLNFVLLSIFTVCESVALGITCAFYGKVEVLMAAGMCAAAFVGLTIFAMQTKIDFTAYMGAAMVVLVVLMFGGILLIFLRIKILVIVYSAVGALLFCFYILIDTQLIMGGDRALGLSPEDYIVGALMLYIDVINLFTFLLQLLHQLNGDD